MYRTTHINISQISYMYKYFYDICINACKLYNRANFIVRQYVSACQYFEKYQPLYPQQLEIYNLVKQVLFGTKHEPTGRWLNYYSLDYLLKTTNDPSYYSLPAHVNQQVLKGLMRDYTSFFEALKEYKLDPSKFLGKPHLPKYKKGLKTAVFTNQVVDLKLNNLGFPVIKFPLTQDTLRITHVPNDTVIKEIRVTPVNGKLKLGIVYEVPVKGIEIAKNSDTLKSLHKLKSLDNIRVMSIDPGVDNICAITNNFGFNPILIKGGNLKSINQFYNKQISEYQSIAKVCNDRYSTKHMTQITYKRNSRIHDYMHKLSRYITDLAVENGVNIVVMGHNDLQKQEISIGHMNNQKFVQIPYTVLADMLRYKLAEEGIVFVTTEESYTSKADFLASDQIPKYTKDPEHREIHSFSGKRISRGVYRHFDGTISNADINGSGNILRKVFPKVLQWDRGIVDMPCVVKRIAV